MKAATTRRTRYMHFGSRIVGPVRVADAAPRCSTVRRSTTDTDDADSNLADLDRRAFARNEAAQRRGRAFWDGRKNAPFTKTTVYFPEDLDLEDGELNLDLQTHDGVLHHSEKTLIQMQKIADVFWAHGGRE